MSALHSTQTRRLLFVGAYPASGSDRNLTASGELAAQLADRGWPVHLVSRRGSGLARLADIMITVLSRRASFEIALIDVFSGAALRWAEAAALICRLRGIPYILALHGGNLPWQMRRTPTRLRRLLGAAQAVVAPSGYLATALGDCGVPIAIIPNGIDVARFRVRARGTLQPRLIWLRAMHAIYNPVMAVRAVASLQARFADVSLDMIGPDKDGTEDVVRAAISERGLEHCIALRGHIPKETVAEALDSADIFINTTNVDNAPVSVLEAMASGMCVVTTDVGGLRYLCTDGQDALLVAADDSDAMADAVATILSDSELAVRLSTNARLTAEEASWPRVLAAWEGVLRSVR